MVDKISVTVQVDLDGKYVRIVATGCLTGASQRALHPLIRRARVLTPGIHVIVDLRGAHLVEPVAVDLVAQQAEQHVEDHGRARIADVGVAVDRGAADIERHPRRIGGFERALGARGCIVEVQGHLCGKGFGPI